MFQGYEQFVKEQFGVEISFSEFTEADGMRFDVAMLLFEAVLDYSRLWSAALVELDSIRRYAEESVAYMVKRFKPYDLLGLPSKSIERLTAELVTARESVQRLLKAYQTVLAKTA